MLLAASVCVLLATCAAAQRPLPGPAHLARAAPGGCSVADFGAVPDNKTDNTAAFRAASRAERCSEILVPAGVWLTGPFNLSSHTTLNVVRGATISGSMDSAVYPVVTQQPEDEAYRAPWMGNRQHQALVSSFFTTNVTLTGGGTIDGNGWPWWKNTTWCNTKNECTLPQRPKLVEFVDANDITVENVTLVNSPFWTLHPINCNNVRISHVHVKAPRDHGNTDGIDPDSCNNVHVTDCTIDVGDDAVSVKSGLHWKTKHKVAASNYLFERVTILYRNFAIGSAVSGDVTNITFRDSTIGDAAGSSPWALKIKTDSQQGGVVDGVYFKNITIGNITYCGSSKFVFTPPHAATDSCSPVQKGATMFGINMGYVGAKTNPGVVRNVVFDGIVGIGPTGVSFSARGLPNASNCTGCVEHIQNVTLRNIKLETGGVYNCNFVDGLVVDNVEPWDAQRSTCPRPTR